MRHLLFRILRPALYPLAKLLPLPSWPYLFGLVYGVKLPDKVKPQAAPTTYGSANINIVLALLEKAADLPGDIAECGVFRGATLTPMAYHCRTRKLEKTLFGFDSFRGFDERELDAEMNDNAKAKRKEAEDFTTATVTEVKKKLSLVGASQHVRLVEGFFAETLQKVNDRKFCFVHLDCDLAAAYATCLPFFYERLVSGGIMLFDEYRDPVYQDATGVIDRFFADKPEKPRLAESDNYMKYYIVRQ